MVLFAGIEAFTREQLNIVFCLVYATGFLCTLVGGIRQAEVEGQLKFANFDTVLLIGITWPITATIGTIPLLIRLIKK